MQEITVNVIKRNGRNLYLRYTDPVTGKRHERDSGTTSKAKAQRAAGDLQSQLRAGVDSRGRILTWSEFRERYEDNHFRNLKPRSIQAIDSSLNAVEATMRPDKMSRVSTQWITRFQQLRLQRVSASTVQKDCRHLKAALNWAKDQGYLTDVPKFPKLKQARRAKKAMKGRPITTEEFERVLQAADRLPEAQRQSMKHLLQGLWLSGLRLGEALSLTWDEWSDGIRVDASGEFVLLLIDAEDEKGGQDRQYPVTPDFAEFLLSTPWDEREDHVFKPILKTGLTRSVEGVSRAISRLGQGAGVKVDVIKKRDPKTGNMLNKTVYASAHDFRRSFGFRWAKKVMPMVLKDLMRHESVITTEKFYVGIQAIETARHLHNVVIGEKVTSEVTSSGSEST